MNLLSVEINQGGNAERKAERGNRKERRVESWESSFILDDAARSFLPFAFCLLLLSIYVVVAGVELLLVLSCCCCSQLVVDSLLLLLLLLCLLCACACVCFHSFVCHCCLPIEVRLCLPGENASRRQRCSGVFIFYCTTNLHALNHSNMLPFSLSLFAAAAPGQRQSVGWQ